MVVPTTCDSGLHSTSHVFDDEEEEIDIMNHSDDDEPLSTSSLPFEFPDITSTIPTQDPVFKKRILLDSDDITTLKLKQKKSLSSSTSSIVPCNKSSPALSSSTSSISQSRQANALPYPSQYTKIGRPKKKSKQAKYPRSEGPSDESSDSSSDELKSFVKDVKARDYWEKYERRMYQEQMEKRKNILATKWLVSGNRRTPSQLQKDKELERLMGLNIFAPVPKDIVDELEDSPAATVPKLGECKNASFRELSNYDEEDGYDETTTSQFFKQYKGGRVKCEWREPELSLITPRKLLASYFGQSNSRNSRRRGSQSGTTPATPASSIAPRRRIKNEEESDEESHIGQAEISENPRRRLRSSDRNMASAPSASSADSDDGSLSENEEEDEDYEGSEQEIEEVEGFGEPLTRRRTKKSGARNNISAVPSSNPSSPATPACSSPDSSLSPPSSPSSTSSFNFFGDNMDSPLFPMSPTLSLPSPFGSPISSPLILTHHHDDPHTPPSSAFFNDGEGTLDFENMVVKLEGDGEMDLELGLGLGLDVDLRKSSSSISAAFESGVMTGLGWSIAPSSPRRPSPPPPLVLVKAESADPEFSLSKKSKSKDGKDKEGKEGKEGKDGKDKKKRPTLPKKEVDEKDLKERDGKKSKKDEKEKEESDREKEKEEKAEKEREEEKQSNEDDDKGDLEPSLKRAKRFCMDSKVQKHFQLTLWYDEEKVLFKELFCAFGRDWSQISLLMCGTKSPTQIKNFYYDVRRSLLTSLFGSEELAHIGGALPAIDKESEKEKEKIRRERERENRIKEENKIKEENRLKEEKEKKEKEIKEEDGSDKECKEKESKDKKRPLSGTPGADNDKDKAGPPKKKSKSGNMVFKFKYRMPAQTAIALTTPAVPPVGANVYCQYRHAPGWVEASILALKGNDADVKAKLLVKGLPHYRAFWATPAQIKYSLEEGTEIFEYSAEDSEMEKNSTPPNNTYTPNTLSTSTPIIYTPTPTIPVPPVIPANETKLVAMEDKCKLLMDTLVPVDRNKLYQWFENKLESMNAATAAAAASSSSSSSSSSSTPSCASPTTPALPSCASPMSAPNSPPVLTPVRPITISNSSSNPTTHSTTPAAVASALPVVTPVATPITTSASTPITTSTPNSATPAATNNSTSSNSATEIASNTPATSAVTSSNTTSKSDDAAPADTPTTNPLSISSSSIILSVPSSSSSLSSSTTSLSLSSSSSNSARYKSYLECVSAIFEEKDLININFASIFGTTIIIGNRDLDSAKWIRRHFDTLLTAVDQGVTLILTRSSASYSSRRVPPVPTTQPMILPKKIMAMSAISPIPTTQILPSNSPALTLSANIARISSPPLATTSSIVTVTASIPATASASGLPHMVSVAISPLVAKTPAALAAATLSAQAPSMLAQAGASAAASNSFGKIATQSAQPGMTSPLITASNAATAAAKAAILMAPTQSINATIANAVRVAPNALTGKNPTQILQQRTQIQTPLTQAQALQAQPATQAQQQLKLQTSPIVIQKQTIATQPAITPVVFPVPAGSPALMRAQLTQSAPVLTNAGNSAYAVRTAQTIVTQPVPARTAATQQMVPQQPVVAQQAVSQVVPQQTSPTKPLYTLGPVTPSTAATSMAASTALARPQTLAQHPQLRQLLPASTTPASSTPASTPTTTGTPAYNTSLAAKTQQPCARSVLTQSAPQMFSRTVTSTPTSTTPFTTPTTPTTVPSTTTTPTPTITPTSVPTSSTPFTTPTMTPRVVSPTLTHPIQTPTPLMPSPSVYIPPSPATTPPTPTTTPSTPTQPTTTITPYSSSTPTPTPTPTTQPPYTSTPVVMTRTGPVTYPYSSIAPGPHALAKSAAPVCVNAAVPPARSAVKVNMPVPTSNAQKLVSSMTAVTAPGTPMANSVTTSPYGKPGMKATNMPTTLSAAYATKPCATCVNTKHVCTVGAMPAHPSCSPVSCGVMTKPSTGVVTCQIPANSATQNARVVSTVASVLSGAALAGSAQAKLGVLPCTAPMQTPASVPVAKPLTPASTSLTPITVPTPTPTNTTLTPASTPATPSAFSSSLSATSSLITSTPTQPIQPTTPTKPNLKPSPTKANGNNNAKAAQAAQTQGSSTSVQGNNSSNSSQNNSSSQGSGASFGADKNPAPYKLFIAKRELTLECRRLLRARCECMSYENKKNIENSTSTKDILSKMAELTNQLVSFKIQLFTIAGERYTVFKDHVTSPSSPSSTSTSSAPSPTSPTSPIITTPNPASSSAIPPTPSSPPISSPIVPTTPTKVSISPATADIFQSIFDDDLLMEDVDDIDYFDM